MRTSRLIWIGLIPAAVYLYCQIHYGGQPVARISHYVLQFFFLLLASSSLLAAAYKTEPSLARTLGFLAAGTIVWTFTTILELLEVLLNQPNYGTVADGFWITGYLPMLAGMQRAAFVSGGLRTSQAKKSGIAWLTLSGMVIVLGSLFAGTSSASTFLLFLALVYHIADALLVYWALVAFVNRRAHQQDRPWNQLLIAFALIYLINLIVILQEFTSPLHLWSAAGFSFAYLFLFLAGKSSIGSAKYP